MRKLFAVLAIVVIALVGAFLYGNYKARKLPDNRPARFLKLDPAVTGKTVVCIGDSITHGSISCNYVDILAEKLGGKGFRFVNAGINGELAYNVTLRLDEIARCRPDAVTVLIGTNDADASMSEENGARIIEEMLLPQKPTKAWFREHLVKICRELRRETSAKIALLSLPPIGEEPASPAYRRAVEYSAVIKDVALMENVSYLPLNEKMDEHISARPYKPGIVYGDDNQMIMYKAIVMHILLGRSWDDISRSNGQLLLTDLLHLNCAGAAMTAELIEKFLDPLR